MKKVMIRTKNKKTGPAKTPGSRSEGQRRNESRGSIILELSIAIPIFIAVSIIALSAINIKRAEISFAQAVDQTTNEVALAIPILNTGSEIISDILSGVGAKAEEENDNENYSGIAGALGIVNALSDYVGFEGEDVVGTLIFGKAIRDRIMDNFLLNCENEIIIQSIDHVSVYVDVDLPNHTVYMYTYYRCNTPFNSFERKIVSAIPMYGRIRLSLTDNQQDPEKDSVWSLHNFDRGQYFRELFGANLPFSYPVIASFIGGTATSIKSIDLTAPYYESGDGLHNKIQNHINELAQFSGTEQPWGSDNIQIDGQSITDRVLKIVIPENSPEHLVSEISGYQSYANDHGVKIEIQTYGVSDRYSESSESESG